MSDLLAVWCLFEIEVVDFSSQGEKSNRNIGMEIKIEIEIGIELILRNKQRDLTFLLLF